ncbi:MAG TPA: ferritin-like domain-containing protein [Gaiellaceae bacterium]|jgi:rubrerythrin|nr:ferritin-like domain-containing protein [Gaiellaceae bacterium]
MTELFHEDAAATTRTAFLRRAAVFGGGVLAASALPATAFAAPGKQGDVAILNFALTLEYLEAAFYATAAAKAPLTGEVKTFARTVAAHEAQHVGALKATVSKLGGRPVAKPSFDFGSAFSSQSAFLRTSTALEETGVSAYNGAGPSLNAIAVKQAAASIVAVEAQHAAWVKALLHEPGAPAAFDTAKTKAEVLAAAGPFIRG